MSLDLHALLRHAGELHGETRLDGLLARTHEAVMAVTRYRQSWLAVFEPQYPECVRMVHSAGVDAKRLVSEYPLIPVAGDAMVNEVLSVQRPVVVLDAQTDPRTNKAIVGPLGSRTIVNVPVPLGNRVLGLFGVGTFGKEGVLAPTDVELETLTIFASQLAHAIERIRFHDEQAHERDERHALELRLQGLQRVELLSMLASGLSHELNNTLAVVSSNLRSLDTTRLSSDDREAIDDSMAATARAIDVVANLRALGKSRPSRREDIDLDARVTHTLRLVRSSIPVSVTVLHEAGKAPPVAGDPEQLDHALAALLIHARDGLQDRGTIRVRVDGAQVDEAFARRHGWARPGSYARVSVHDSGPGLSSEVLERLTDPQLLTTSTAGSSLGLAIVTRVVQQHDGLLECQSAPGEGTRFSLYFPVAMPA